MANYIGWHLMSEDCKLPYGDGRQVHKGVTYRVDGEPVEFEHGFYASKDPMSAIFYASGPMLGQVELSGEVIVANNQAIGTVQTELIRRAYIETELIEFAKWCAARAKKRNAVDGAGTNAGMEAITSAEYAADAADPKIITGIAAFYAARRAANCFAYAADTDVRRAAGYAVASAGDARAALEAALAKEQRAQRRKLTQLFNRAIARGVS